MATALRVGIIGASAEGGLARDGHVPAVPGLPGLELAAVATNSRKTADAAAEAFGVPAAFANGMDLIRAPDIDLVTVTTRVPDHRELVLAALATGKHVETPFTSDVVAEAGALLLAGGAARGFRTGRDGSDVAARGVWPTAPMLDRVHIVRQISLNRRIQKVNGISSIRTTSTACTAIGA